MSFRLVDSGWDELLRTYAVEGSRSWRIICPFIKEKVITRLLMAGTPTGIRVITRFSLRDFFEGVSDLEALRFLLDQGADIRGVRNLHSKLYQFGEQRVVLTSANLTEQAMRRNQEFGFASDDAEILTTCQKYFDTLWAKAGPSLDHEWLGRMEAKVAKARGRSEKRQPHENELEDEGTSVGSLTRNPSDGAKPSIKQGGPRGFVKFFGDGRHRLQWDFAILDEMRRSGSHWACTYPSGKRPRQVKDGDFLFLSRMVQNPNDILVYGRAVGLKHVEGRDDASIADIALRDWKEKWPHYIRLQEPQFIRGRLSAGVSLNRLMDELGSDAFEPTQINFKNGIGNTNPRLAYMQQPAVQLSAEGIAWLSAEFLKAIELSGEISDSELANLDWPEDRPFQLEK